MVQLAGVTYRIERASPGSYTVVRISDDCDVGTFRLAPALEVEPRAVEPGVLREIARLAIHTAKTSTLGLPPPERDAAAVISVGGAASLMSGSAQSTPPALGVLPIGVRRGGV